MALCVVIRTFQTADTGSSFRRVRTLSTLCTRIGFKRLYDTRVEYLTRASALEKIGFIFRTNGMVDPHFRALGDTLVLSPRRVPYSHVGPREDIFHISNKRAFSVLIPGYSVSSLGRYARHLREPDPCRFGSHETLISD